MSALRDPQPEPTAPRMRTRESAGVVAGLVAGAVMALFMMGWMVASGTSVWTNPNLIAVMWVGREAALGGFSGATLLGFATHMATSALMGWIAVPFVRDLPPGRTILVAIVYAVASYPFVFALVLTWANPLMVEQTALVPMTLAHVLFGIVLGAVYLQLRPPNPHGAPGPVGRTWAVPPPVPPVHQPDP